MTDMELWEKENEAFLAKIGQVKQTVTKTATTKKDEE